MSETKPEQGPPATLAELNTMCRATLRVRVPSADPDPTAWPVVECRRLTPSQSAQVELELKRAMPTLVPGNRPGEERFNLTDPDYLARKQAAYVRGRALALWCGVPMFAAGHPELAGASLDRITEVMQGELTEEILNLLFAAVVPGTGAEMGQAVEVF